MPNISLTCCCDLPCAHSHMPVILEFVTFCFMVADLGPPPSLCQIEFLMYRNHGDPKKGVQAMLFGSVMIICIHAPDSAKDFEEYEKFMGEMTKVQHEGLREGARRFYIASVFQHRVRILMCADEDEELREMYGPQCWHGFDGDPGLRRRCGTRS